VRAAHELRAPPPPDHRRPCGRPDGAAAINPRRLPPARELSAIRSALGRRPKKASRAAAVAADDPPMALDRGGSPVGSHDPLRHLHGGASPFEIRSPGAGLTRRGAQRRHSCWPGTVQAWGGTRRNEASCSLCHGGVGDLARYRLHAGLPSAALALNRRRRWDARSRESQTDRSPLSGGHARRLRARTLAAHLLAWKLETK
jgi:hypothetical protein